MSERWRFHGLLFPLRLARLEEGGGGVERTEAKRLRESKEDLIGDRGRDEAKISAVVSCGPFCLRWRLVAEH